MFLPIKEASEALGVHPKTLEKWARAGKIEYYYNEAGQRRYSIEVKRQDVISPDEEIQEEIQMENVTVPPIKKKAKNTTVPPTEKKAKDTNISTIGTFGESVKVTVVPKAFTTPSTMIWQAMQAAINEWGWPADMEPGHFLDAYLYISFKQRGITLGGYTVLENNNNGSGENDRE